MTWLRVAQEATSGPPDGSDVGEILRWYRKRENLTQHDVAALLNTTQSRLSKLEKGTQALARHAISTCRAAEHGGSTCGRATRTGVRKRSDSRSSSHFNV
ncbi:helix-turn-helix domain-containing protein [Pseudonocardia zijingensis]|uniref:HTH cro/C1-type domain-containing protein n=1 Tax=Pseudonocardia zijingensis TaxID=153376 RepID=A0ABP4AK75_9PSEU